MPSDGLDRYVSGYLLVRWLLSSGIHMLPYNVLLPNIQRREIIAAQAGICVCVSWIDETCD